MISYEQGLADIYRLLSACFYLPDKKLFNEERLFDNLAALFSRVCPQAEKCSMKMAGAFSIYSEEDLIVEYAKLFVGPNELLAPPYGSVYLNGGNRVMGDATMQVGRMYEDAGLCLQEDVIKEPSDHISLELEFIYYLIHKRIRALNKEDFKNAELLREKQQFFHDKFLATWVPDFTDRIKKSTQNRFYSFLADCLNTFVLFSRKNKTDNNR